MALSPGSRVGCYEIVADIGAGGMGEVYRAHDTKLDRDVALKVLPPAFTAQADRVARFQREARLLAALNHPYIGAIYGLEEASGVPALVLELIDGETLQERIRRGPLPVAKALTFALQMADALEAAHASGIIHRDFKPSNVKITRDERVKVLDFGLARTLGSDKASADPFSTMTMDGTNPGAVLGTAAYMGPEQARGQAVDERTDIWAFGCVLFEMLTGSRAFLRATVTDTLAAIVGAEPDWTKLPRETPAAVQRLLRRCLQKDLRRRLHDIADARIELEEVIAAPEEAAVAQPSRRWSRGPLLAGLLAIAAIALLWAARDRFRAADRLPANERRVVRLTDLPGLEESPAISPDGRSVAFTAGVAGRRQLFVQLIAGGAPLQITRDAADHEFPRWAPDSNSIFYFSGAAPGELQGNIWEISALGGVPRRVVNSVGGADVSVADGRLAFFRLSERGIQLVTGPRDGSRFDVVSDFAPITYYLSVRWSPDGRWIAFQRGDSIRFDVFVVPALGGQPRQLTHENNMMSGFAWLPDSTGIIYGSSRGGTMPYLPKQQLWQVTLSDGVVQQVTSGETSYVTPDISKSGVILVGRLALQSDIWKFPIDGPPADNVRRGIRVTHQTGAVLTPTAGPGDKEVAFLSDSGGHANLWVVNSQTGELRQITHESDPHVSLGVPVWSPTGRSIAFVSSRGNEGLTFGVWLVDADGSNLRNVANPGLGPAWSADGRWLYYATRGGAAATDVEVRKVPVDGGPAVTVRAERARNVIGLDGSTIYYLFERPLNDGTPEFEIRAATPEDAPFRVVARIPASRVPLWQIINPALSPDGKWLAQALTDGFTTNLWVLSTATGEWRQVTDFGDRPTFIARRVSWSSDGRSILAAVGEGDSDIVLLDGLLNSKRD
jgi:Tol biopolymer transport system component